MPSRFRLVFFAALLGYAWLLWAHIGVFAGGADSSGYLASARLLTEGRLRAPMRTLPGAPVDRMDPRVYMPLGFRTVGSAELAPTYPVGLPLLIAAAAPIPGLEMRAAVLLLLHAVAGVWLTFCLALECGLSPRAAALAALLLASSAVYLFVSVTLMSDVPALVWTTAAVLAMWRSRRDARWALASGAALSLAVLIRPTNALALIPILVCAGASPRRWLLLAAGGIPGAILFFAYNLGAYGGLLATGYVEHDHLFGLTNVLPGLRHYAAWLPVVLTPIVVFVLGLPWLLRRTPALPTVLLLWIVVFLGFYTIYAYTYEAWWFTRFLLPAFPPLIVGALCTAQAAFERVTRVGSLAEGLGHLARPVPAGVATALIAAAVMAHNVAWGRRLDVFVPGRGEARYLAAAEWATTHLPAGAGILAMQASGALFHYTRFPVLRWDLIDGDALRSLERDAQSGRHPLFAVLFPYDFDMQVRDRLQGRWTQVATIDNVTVWRFDGLTESVGSIPADERWFP